MSDHTTLREHLAETLARADDWQWEGIFARLDTPMSNHYRKLADAALTALPPATDQVALLREAADRIDETRDPFPIAVQNGITWATAELRRMAAATAHKQPETETRTVAYRSPDTRTLYCVTCARQETGWTPVPGADVQNWTCCDFCGGSVLTVASHTLGQVVARHLAADTGQGA